MEVTAIIAALEGRLAAVTSFTKLPYVYNVSKNNWKMIQDGYAARPGSTDETATVTNRLTYIQSFEVVLTKGYMQSSVGDLALQSAVTELSDLMHSVFVDAEQTRLNIPSTVLNVLNLSIDEPEVYEDEKVVALTGRINILYRLEV